jgi:hypothetical protein
VTLRLTKKWLSDGRVIVADNFFTSCQLGKELWLLKTFLLGTIRINRSGNPEDFVSDKLEPTTEGKSKYVFRQQETLMKFQAKPTKQVLLYSTKHHKPELSRNGKPKMITDYNETKFGVDIFDEMCGRHTYSPPVRRWPLRLFMHMVDAAAVNAYILFGQNTPRREFIGKLADQLMQTQKDLRRTNKKHWLNVNFVEIENIYKRQLFISLINTPTRGCDPMFS